MRKVYEFKSVDNSVKDVDSTTRRVKVAISHMGSKDLDVDVIDHNAFTKTIAERGPNGKDLIWHLTDHYPSLKYAVAKFSELYKEGDYLVGITDIPNTTWGNDVLEMYKTGMINQHSIGFRTIKSEPMNAGTPEEYRLIKEILLYEGSAVLWGANPNTPTLSVGKSATPEMMAKRYQELTNSFKTGDYTDETFAILEAQIKQIEQDMAQKYLQSIQTTEPVQATQPEVKISDVDIYLLIQKHF